MISTATSLPAVVLMQDHFGDGTSPSTASWQQKCDCQSTNVLPQEIFYLSLLIQET